MHRPNVSLRSVAAGLVSHVAVASYNSSARNLAAALVSRVLRLKAPADLDEQHKCVQWLMANHSFLYRNCPRQLEPMDWLPYLKRYAPAQARSLQAGKDEFQQHPTDRINSTVPFMKVEGSVSTDGHSGTAKAPRAVCSAKPPANARIGPSIVVAMDALASQVWVDQHLVTSTCHMQPHEIGDSIYRSSLVCSEVYEYDFEKFETCRKHWTHEYERHIIDFMGLNRMVAGGVTLCQAMAQAEAFRARTRSGIRARAKDVLISGRPDTTFGNTLTNGAIMLYSVSQGAGGLSAESLWRLGVRLYVNGDDSLLFSPIKPDIEAARRLGFIPTGGRVQLSSAKFCSMRCMPAIDPATCSPTVAMLPQLGRVHTRSGILVQPPTRQPSQLSAIIAASATCMLNQVTHCEPWRSWYLAMLRGRSTKLSTSSRRWHRKQTLHSGGVRYGRGADRQLQHLGWYQQGASMLKEHYRTLRDVVGPAVVSTAFLAYTIVADVIIATPCPTIGTASMFSPFGFFMALLICWLAPIQEEIFKSGPRHWLRLFDPRWYVNQVRCDVERSDNWTVFFACFEYSTKYATEGYYTPALPFLFHLFNVGTLRRRITMHALFNAFAFLGGHWWQAVSLALFYCWQLRSALTAPQPVRCGTCGSVYVDQPPWRRAGRAQRLAVIAFFALHITAQFMYNGYFSRAGHVQQRQKAFLNGDDTVLMPMRPRPQPMYTMPIGPQAQYLPQARAYGPAPAVRLQSQLRARPPGPNVPIGGRLGDAILQLATGGGRQKRRRRAALQPAAAPLSAQAIAKMPAPVRAQYMQAIALGKDQGIYAEDYYRHGRAAYEPETMGLREYRASDPAVRAAVAKGYLPDPNKYLNAGDYANAKGRTDPGGSNYPGGHPKDGTPFVMPYATSNRTSAIPEFRGGKGSAGVYGDSSDYYLNNATIGRANGSIAAFNSAVDRKYTADQAAYAKQVAAGKASTAPVAMGMTTVGNTTTTGRMSTTKGTFTVRHPKTGKPMRVNGMKVTHTEFVRDITATQDLNIRSFPVNPGNAGLMPMCAAQAGTFDSFMTLGFSASVKTAANQTYVGRVALAYDNEITDADPTIKREMLDLYGAKSAAYWQNDSCKLKLGQAQRTNFYYVMGSQSIGLDPRITTPAKLLLMTVDAGATSGSHAGELWVSYSFLLFNQNLLDASLGNPLRVTASSVGNYGSWNAAMQDPVNRVAGSNNNIGVVAGNDPRVPSSMINSNATAIILPYVANSDSSAMPIAGVYTLANTLRLVGGGPAINSFALALSSSVTYKNLATSSTPVDIQANAGGVTEAVVEVNMFSNVVPVIMLIPTMPGTAGAFYAAELSITPLNVALTGDVTAIRNDGVNVTTTREVTLNYADSTPATVMRYIDTTRAPVDDRADIATLNGDQKDDSKLREQVLAKLRAAQAARDEKGLPPKPVDAPAAAAPPVVPAPVPPASAKPDPAGVAAAIDALSRIVRDYDDCGKTLEKTTKGAKGT